MRRAVLLLAGLAAAAMGCRNGNYGYAQITQQVGDRTADLDLNSAVTLDEGSASSVDVNLHAKDGDVLAGSLASVDPTILQVEGTPTDPNRYVFLGVKAGVTQVTITVKGAVVATVQATVNPPPDFTPPEAGAPQVVPEGGTDGGTDGGSG